MTEDVRNAALKLSPKRRAKLAEQLLDSLDQQIPADLQAQWADEIEDRINAYDAGEMNSKPLWKLL